MLHSLKIRNYAIIRETDIHFQDGLNIITGETGAGKSILIGALGLILGSRADTKVLFPEADKCSVEGEFSASNESIRQFFESNELDQDERILVRREITSSGKTRAFINDTPVNLPLLRTLGLLLVDVVSQHQTLDLNEAQFQLEMFDAIAGTAHELEAYQTIFEHYDTSLKRYQSLLATEKQSRTDEDYIRFVLSELDQAQLKEGEEMALESEIDVLSHASSIAAICASSLNTFEESEHGLSDQLRNISSALQSAGKHHLGLAELAERFNSSLIEMLDVIREVGSIGEKVQADPSQLEKMEQRLQLLLDLQKKHRVQSSSELIALRISLEDKLNKIGSLADELDQAKIHLDQALAETTHAANQLSVRRKSQIEPIVKGISALLVDVAIPQAKFEIDISALPEDAFNEYGCDQLTFYFSANKGFPVKPLHQVASGGELSRLMLCLKSMISDQVSLPTIVFDEIDTGISGEAALRVASVMKNHASKHQVIAITHLPQIAAKANEHFYVYKENSTEQTTTHIRKLTEAERIYEIARMMSGENPSDAAIHAAKELIQS